MKIIKVDFMDYDVKCGADKCLTTYYLIDPNKDKLSELKQLVEGRFDYKDDDTLSDKQVKQAEEFAWFAWDFIDEFIQKNFKVLTIDEHYEILW